ncbi:MAG TPA: hypothetical protein VFQ45_07160 [Longimicrobium sp.]|nr:hypothetical protein [Longimicrobium sp.]
MAHRTASPAPLPWLTVLLLPLAAACGGRHGPLPDLSGVGDTTGLVARGEYLVRSVGACGHCHAADPRDSDGPLSGGLAFRNWRLGTIRAANLTPDSATGLGRWTDAEIVRAIRTGEDREGHLLAPVMPYEWLNKLSDRDALAIARYLRTLPPVRNEARSRPNLVFQAARLLFLRPVPESRQARPARGATPAYGGYLATGPALCADCHTQRRGIQQRPDRRRLLAGAAKPPKSFPARPANLTPDAETGIGRWSEDDFLRTLRTGINPQGDTLHPFMPWRQYRRMTDDDLRAIHRYLRSLPPIRNPIPGHEHAEGHQH